LPKWGIIRVEIAMSALASVSPQYRTLDGARWGPDHARDGFLKAGRGSPLVIAFPGSSEEVRCFGAFRADVALAPAGRRHCRGASRG
jgi:hypothetical protein